MRQLVCDGATPAKAEPLILQLISLPSKEHYSLLKNDFRLKLFCPTLCGAACVHSSFGSSFVLIKWNSKEKFSSTWCLKTLVRSAVWTCGYQPIDQRIYTYVVGIVGLSHIIRSKSISGFFPHSFIIMYICLSVRQSHLGTCSMDCLCRCSSCTQVITADRTSIIIYGQQVLAA